MKSWLLAGRWLSGGGGRLGVCARPEGQCGQLQDQRAQQRHTVLAARTPVAWPVLSVLMGIG
ncbi:hypothetical protein GCM10010289_79180 [Streptomyces violascens]|nr:hypothetical protein GCM10010289_79180 [Streptomyces violascens]